MPAGILTPLRRASPARGFFRPDHLCGPAHTQTRPPARKRRPGREVGTALMYDGGCSAPQRRRVRPAASPGLGGTSARSV